MVRLMLVLAPVMCILSGIGISSILYSYMKNLDTPKSSTSGVGSSSEKKRKSDDNYPKKSEVGNCVMANN
jgi:dolichyl-diphosphooligosaccharide---protein glycosyltransferase